MNILAMLGQNLRRGIQTLRFPARPPVTEGYRGLVQFDQNLCSGCAMCRFRCTARAITFTAGKGTFTWSYDPGQCTFCGRCVDGCKEHALSQDPTCPPIYLSAGTLKKSYTLQRKPPARKNAAPASDPTQASLPGAS